MDSTSEESQEDDDKTQSEENDDELWDMSTADEEEGLDEQVPDSAPSPDEEAIVKRLLSIIQLKYGRFNERSTTIA
uniref:Uncharacterized protein n=1 Tax=Timema douglasi TaxID=61478 RepID=A0A7R8VRZ6_TIMDO|nr:unnamed protein product [Timema douglasi]